MMSLWRNIINVLFLQTVIEIVY